MFTLYCDDSGTHKGSDIAVAGCYLATVEQWENFKRNWQEINDREHFGVFRMADFVAHKAQFAEPQWQDDAKRGRTIRALISTIKLRAQVGFSAAVVKSAFDEVITDDIREKFGDNHYTLAVRLCIGLVNQWRNKYGYREPIQYVFDRLSEGKGDIDKMFSIYVKGKDHALQQFGIYEDCWSFQDKAQVVQLQAADIWAYENFRYMRDCFMPTEGLDKLARVPRRSYMELRESPVQIRYHVRRTLKKLADRAREITAEIQ